MKYDREFGKLIIRKYLDESLQQKLKHSEGVGEFAFKIAQRVKERNPELALDPEFLGFLGYVHDIGYSVQAKNHELHTIGILVKEGIPTEIARRTIHGQLPEQYSEKKYLPKGIEGMILTYTDMSVRTGKPISMKKRAKEIIKRLRKHQLSDCLKQEILDGLHKAMPRFERYEKIVLALAGVKSVKYF